MDGKGDPQSEDDKDDVESNEEVSTKPSRKAKPATSEHSHDEDEGSEIAEDDYEGNNNSDHEDSQYNISMSEGEDDVAPDSSALQDLESFISSLDAGKKRKAPDDDTNIEGITRQDRSQKRRVLKDRTEAGEENEFATHNGNYWVSTPPNIFNPLMGPQVQQNLTWMIYWHHWQRPLRICNP